jgi:MFS transporter, PHS family, inorganic phosphate transporter
LEPVTSSLTWVSPGHTNALILFKLALISSSLLQHMLHVLVELTPITGANTLTFILPAEIFPTRYRCTCHGISAAAGELGSVFVQAILPHMSFGGVKANDPNSHRLGYLFIIFGIVMGFGALFAWALIPEVQNRRDDEGGFKFPSKTLEDLGMGLREAERESQVIGFRNKFKKAFGSHGLRSRRN